MKGKLTISRWSSNKPPFTGISIEVTDETSGTQFLSVQLTPEALGLAITGMSRQDCEFDLRAQNVGKIRETKTEVIPFKATDYKKREEEAKATLIPYEVEGWEGSWRDLCNHHRSAGNYSYRVSFTRFVEPQSAPTTAEAVEKLTT